MNEKFVFTIEFEVDVDSLTDGMRSLESLNDYGMAKVVSVTIKDPPLPSAYDKSRKRLPSIPKRAKK